MYFKASEQRNGDVIHLLRVFEDDGGATDVEVRSRETPDQEEGGAAGPAHPHTGGGRASRRHTTTE